MPKDVEMFTGLVREIGRIEALHRRGGLTQIVVAAPRSASHLQIGDSLAVNGICLTVTALQGPRLIVEAAPETYRITTLRRWRAGDRLHLEPSLRLGDDLGGHLVLGHVDGMGRILQRHHRGGSLLLQIGVPAPLVRYLLPKGSVAVDGVSLTVDGGPFRDRFTVNLIPHTLSSTCLGLRRPPDAVNLEMDVLVKAARGAGQIPMLLASQGRSLDDDGRVRTPDQPAQRKALSMDFLLERGFGRRR
jgi:riboflavin synthase alpha subunit